VSLFLTLALLLSVSAAWAQEEAEANQPPAPAEEEPPQEPDAAEEETPQEPAAAEEVLTYDDYTVKGYSLSFFAGQSSGAKYLENMDLSERTILTEEEAAIMGFDGEVLRVSLDQEHYTGAHKEIQSGPAYGGRIGIYISDDFHLDLLGTYAKGEVVTTMTYYPDGISDDPDALKSRVEVDRDAGYKMIKGGLGLMYDATPAKFFGLVPRLGFGLGGIINRFSNLPDVTGLYLEGNLGLNAELFKNFELGANVDLANFAFEVDELGYSNVVNYLTYSLGITYFFDVLPPDVRAAHQAEKE
jgi:hypothetical protein